MKGPTRLGKTLETIFGRDQAKGLKRLSEVLNVEKVSTRPLLYLSSYIHSIKHNVQIFLDRGAPLCVIVPELDSLTKEAVERIDDSNKVALSILLDALSSSASQHGLSTNGFAWEEVQSLLTQAGYLKPTGQNFAVSKVMRGKRRIRWFKKLGDPGSEPSPKAVYEVRSRHTA
jgi:hypothetical protein